MKPYGVKFSFRPGCPCCNNKHLHRFRVRMSESDKVAKRAAKKAERKRYDPYKLAKDEGLI